MGPDTEPRDLSAEADALLDCIRRGDPQASVHLARLFVADSKGALQPFAEALAARLADHLNRYAETGVTDSWSALEDEVYGLMQAASIDWDRIPRAGRPGEEA